jgi:RNA polymerase sigma-70 factor (ECF subfamily)
MGSTVARAVEFALVEAPTLSRVSRVPDRTERKVRDDAGDEQAVEAFQKGDKAAFDALVLKYQRMVYRVCFRYAGSHSDADDLAQEVFLRAFRGLDGFRSQSRFSTWLYRIALNVCLNWASSKKASQNLPENLPDLTPSALERLSQEETSLRLRRAIERLPEKQRATLLLRVDQELSHKEIAEVMGSPIGTVKANLFFALANLRKLMGAPVRALGRSEK